MMLMLPLPASCRKSRYFKALNVSNGSASSEPNKQQTNKQKLCTEKVFTASIIFYCLKHQNITKKINLQVEEHNRDKIRLQEY
jgi:hypothetical protein